LQVATMTTSGSGIARVWTELVRLPRLIRRLAPHVVLNPNESIPPRLNCGLVVVSQNLFFHCPAIGPLRSGPLAARAASRLQFLYYRRQMPRTYIRADAVIPVSAHAAHELAEHAGLDLSRAHVAHYGADRLPVRDRPAEGSRRVLLVVGAIAHYKRLCEAVEALRILHDLGADYELHLAGEPWPGHREEVASAAARLGVEQSVKFLGALGDEQLADAFATSHVGLALSQCETFGIPVVEGMRAGLPHVVADEPWSAETVGDAAVRVDGARPAAVAAGILSLEDPEEWQRRADAGRLAVERYTWKAQAEAIAGVTATVAFHRLGLAAHSGSVSRPVEEWSIET
jgi:glycosyltransferase involved in cell wall biosynthesis